MDLACTLAVCLALTSGRPPDPGMTMSDFLKELKVREQAIRSRLQQESLWSDPARKEDLLQDLRAAGALRAGSLAPVLAGHLTYSPMGDTEEKGRLTVEDRFPAYAALKQIGILAVPAL